MSETPEGTRPSARDAERCYRFLKFIEDRARDHEYRDESLSESEAEQLARHVLTAMSAISSDEREVHNDLRQLMGWIEKDRKKLTVRNVGRLAGPIAIEVQLYLRYDLKHDIAAQSTDRQRPITIYIEKNQPGPPRAGGPG